MTVYKDPDSLEEKLCVIAFLPGGVFDVEFSLIGVDPAVTIQNYVFLAPHSVWYTKNFQEGHWRKTNYIMSSLYCFPQKWI